MQVEAAQETITINGLNPGSTYVFRLASGQELGPELVVDTQGKSNLRRVDLPQENIAKSSSELHA